MQDYLVLWDESGPRPVELDSNAGPIILGRQEGCEVLLASKAVSRHHAKVFWNGTEYVLQDLASTNGSTVNGNRVQRHALMDKDNIGIGPFRLSYRRVESREALLADMGAPPESVPTEEQSDPTVLQEEAMVVAPGLGDDDAAIEIQSATQPKEPAGTNIEETIKLEGSLRGGFEIREIVEMLAANQKTGLLKVSWEGGEGEMGLVRGRFIRARSDDLRGIEAATNILKVTITSFDWTDEPPEPEEAPFGLSDLI